MPELTPEQQEQYDLQQIKQRPSRYQAKPIGKIIRQALARSGLSQTQAAQQLLQAWQQVAGPALAAASRPGNISRGVLQIHVRDSSVLQELHLCRKQLLQALQQAMPQLNLRDLRGRVGH